MLRVLGARNKIRLERRLEEIRKEEELELEGKTGKQVRGA